MNNLHIYESSREVPAEAMKPIAAGRLKGMTDINPMWRIKRMTELFGPCGEGWGFEVKGREFVPGAEGTVAVFVDILLWYKQGEERCFIPGTGGSMYIAKEKNGLYVSDEAVKMATTDAVSVACKYLGMGANVYWSKDRTKYAAQPTNEEFQSFVNGEEPPKEGITRVQSDMIIKACTDAEVAAICKSRGVIALRDLTAKQAEGIIKALQERGKISA